MGFIPLTSHLNLSRKSSPDRQELWSSWVGKGLEASSHWVRSAKPARCSALQLSRCWARRAHLPLARRRWPCGSRSGDSLGLTWAAGAGPGRAGRRAGPRLRCERLCALREPPEQCELAAERARPRGVTSPLSLIRRAEACAAGRAAGLWQPRPSAQILQSHRHRSCLQGRSPGSLAGMGGEPDLCPSQGCPSLGGQGRPSSSSSSSSSSWVLLLKLLI